MISVLAAPAPKADYIIEKRGTVTYSSLRYRQVPTCTNKYAPRRSESVELIILVHVIDNGGFQTQE